MTGKLPYIDAREVNAGRGKANGADLLRSAIDQGAEGATPELSALGVLRTALDVSRARGGTIYFVDLVKNAYARFATVDPDPERLPLASVPIEDGRDQPEREGELDTGDLWFPIRRGETTIGLLRLRTIDPSRAENTREHLEAIRGLLVSVYERHATTRLLEAIQRPIPFDRNESRFLDEIVQLIRESSGLKFVAIRELDDEGALRCIALAGFGAEPHKPDWDLLDINDNYPTFAEALTGHTVPVTDMSSPANRRLHQLPGNKDVKSYVTSPIMVGTGVFGTLSLAAASKYTFSALELRGLATIANAIGVSITNFRNFHDMSNRYGDIAIAVSAMEVASAVRHETAGIIDRVNGNMGPVESAIPKADTEAQEAMEELLTELDLLQEALEKFKIATSSPTKEPELTSIEEAFNEAKKTVGGRLDSLKIRCRFDGPALELLGYKDWLRHAFLNLILNSMDAFEAKSHKRGREIRLLTEKPVPKAETVTITYTDNAEGIASHLLLGPADSNDLPVRQRIFAPYVTSKKEGYEPKPGSGLGLFLVRKVLSDHGGSIDLAATGPNGSTFKLNLPAGLLEKGKGTQ